MMQQLLTGKIPRRATAGHRQGISVAQPDDRLCSELCNEPYTGFALSVA